MTSSSTRSFTAACAIMQHFGRPGTPNDQAWIESLFGHVKGRTPTPGEDRRRGGARTRAGPGPDRVQHGAAARRDRLRHPRRRAAAGRASARHVGPGSPPRTPPGSPTVEGTRKTSHDPHLLVANFTPRLVQRLTYTSARRQPYSNPQNSINNRVREDHSRPRPSCESSKLMCPDTSTSVSNTRSSRTTRLTRRQRRPAHSPALAPSQPDQPRQRRERRDGRGSDPCGCEAPSPRAVGHPTLP